MLASSLVKYGFRIRTRLGLIVNNLHIHGRDEADAERKLRQMYVHCEVLDCTVTRGVRKGEPIKIEKGFSGPVPHQA